MMMKIIMRAILDLMMMLFGTTIAFILPTILVRDIFGVNVNKKGKIILGFLGSVLVAIVIFYVLLWNGGLSYFMDYR